VSTYSTADFFVRLANVDRLPVVVVENIDAPFEPADIVFAGLILILQFCERVKTLSERSGPNGWGLVNFLLDFSCLDFDAAIAVSFGRC
jgi:hypothetical protein